MHSLYPRYFIFDALTLPSFRRTHSTLVPGGIYVLARPGATALSCSLLPAVRSGGGVSGWVDRGGVRCVCVGGSLSLAHSLSRSLTSLLARCLARFLLARSVGRSSTPLFASSIARCLARFLPRSFPRSLAQCIHPRGSLIHTSSFRSAFSGPISPSLQGLGFRV